MCRGHWDDRSVAIKKVSTAVNMEREVQSTDISTAIIMTHAVKVDVMAKLLHANIVTLYATASKHPEFCIIMGWFSVCGSGSLHESPLCRTGRVLSLQPH